MSELRENLDRIQRPDLFDHNYQDSEPFTCDYEYNQELYEGRVLHVYCAYDYSVIGACVVFEDEKGDSMYLNAGTVYNALTRWLDKRAKKGKIHRISEHFKAKTLDGEYTYEEIQALGQKKFNGLNDLGVFLGDQINILRRAAGNSA